MKAITVQAQWALPMLAGAKGIETRARPVRYRGRVALHIAKTQVEFWQTWHAGHRQNYGQASKICSAIHLLDLDVEDIEDHFGCVSGSFEVTGCVPIVAAGPHTDEDVHRLRISGAVVVDWPVCRRASYYRPGIAPGELSVDITDQLPFGIFAPGRHAVLTANIAHSTYRCPYCWGTGADPEAIVGNCGPVPVTSEAVEAVAAVTAAALRRFAPCPACNGDGHCEPVPARGQLAVPWNWTLTKEPS